ncbi:hypothetical protein HOLleu_30650 [Holothuria leucospilota]|uniref:Uncharacterized protein n=1 Tax=Holothuria leucospilota TaxID=206669 RepID=A0A9Q1BL02_HOLLE|nr:hypothetical protein HOLleu_30650 [Holothuria leucospilota]
MKTTVNFVVTLTLLLQLVIADGSSGNTTAGPEMKVTVSDIITEELWETTFQVEKNTSSNSVTSIVSLTEETQMKTDFDNLLSSTTLSGTFTAPFIKESKSETDMDAVPTSPLSDMTTKMVISTDRMETNSISTSSEIPSQTPSLTSKKRSTPPLPTSAAPHVDTEEVYISTTVFTETSDIEDFHTSTTENEIQTDSTTAQTKPVTSAASGAVPRTSQGPRETTIPLTENDTISYGAPLSTILDDDITTLLEEDITTSGGAITTTSQQPAVRSEDTVSPPIVPQKTFLVVLTLSGNCSKVLQNEEDREKFMKEVKNALVKHFKFLTEEHVVMRDVTCGSILVEFNVEMSEKDKADFDVDMRDNFAFTYKGHVLQVVKTNIEVYVEDTTSPVMKDDGDTEDSLSFQETLIFIVIGSVGGAFVLLSLFLVCQYLVQKLMRANKKSFSPTDEPCIKLSEFNMAHTYIPRPQSIYSATTRSSFLPYESMEQGFGYSSASPTPYVYADGDQIREHYQEVVDKDQAVTPTTKNINDFGKSGIPSWDLPVLEAPTQSY